MATKEVRVLQKDLPAPESGVHINSLLQGACGETSRHGDAGRGAEEVVLRAAKDCGHGHRTMCGHGPRLTTSQPRQGWSAGAPSGRGALFVEDPAGKALRWRRDGRRNRVARQAVRKPQAQKLQAHWAIKVRTEGWRARL